MKFEIYVLHQFRPSALFRSIQGFAYKVIRKFIDVFMKKKHDHHWKANIVYDFCIIEFIAQSQSL